MFIVGQFLSKFKGRIYSLGYPDENECGKSAFSDPGENVTFSLPLGQCGVQMMGLDPVGVSQLIWLFSYGFRKRQLQWIYLFFSRNLILLNGTKSPCTFSILPFSSK